MKHLLFVTAFSIVLIGCSDQNKNGSEAITENEVKEFITAYDGSWSGRDTVKMKEMMDDDYTYFTSTGKVLRRENMLSWFHPADKYKVDTASRSEISYKIRGNTAIVTSHWVGNGSFAGVKFYDDQRCGLVLQKQNGKLKIISEHCVQIE